MDADHPRPRPTPAYPGRSGIVFFLPAVIWAAYFVIIYSVQGATCTTGSPASTAALASLTLVAMLGIGAVGAWGYLSWRRMRPSDWKQEGPPPTRASFLAFATVTHAILFLVATIWVGAAILVLDPCAGHVMAI